MPTRVRTRHPAFDFIELLTGDAATPCCFQWWTDVPASPEPPSHRTGPLSKWGPELRRVNNAGMAVGICVNETDGIGRKAHNVIALRALFIDADRIQQPDIFALPPSLLQARAPTNWYAFWKLKPGEAVKRFRPAQRALSAFYGTDVVADPSRVMRLPGLKHQKGGAAPTEYEIQELHPEAIYTIDEVMRAHGIDPATIVEEEPPPLVPPKPFDGHQILDSEREALEALLPDEAVGRHQIAMNYAIHAIYACLPAEEIQLRLEAWFPSVGRPPARREIHNLIRDADAGLRSGQFTADAPGIRLDLQFESASMVPRGTELQLSPAQAEVQTKALTSWTDKLVLNKDGSWKSHPRNVLLALEHDERLNQCFRYNLFSNQVEVVAAPWRRWPAGVEWTDDDAVALAAWLAGAFAGHPAISADVVQIAVRPFAREHAYHPVRDYLRGLTWDRVPRLGGWTVAYLGAEDGPHHRAVGLRFLIGAVARIFKPGCQMDAMLVLEGAQGIGKSSAVRALFDPWFTDAMLDISHKDAAQTIRGQWGVELGEMHAFSRGEQTQIKSYISRRADRQRDSHMRNTETHDRQCVFIGTTNQDFYQMDSTGGRRFWPVACGKIDLPGLGRDRDQLWAEALALHEAGERHHLTVEEEGAAGIEQEKRHLQDEWVGRIRTWLEAHDGFDVSAASGVTGMEVWIGALDGEAKHLRRNDQVRIAECMRKAGFRPQTFRRGKSVLRGYVSVANATSTLLPQGDNTVTL